MAGMYPDNKEITIYGEKVQWPGVDKNGKFTNGSFSDPHEPPSFIPAGTINLILDNLSELITKLGGKPDNTSVTQLANVIKAAAQGDSTDKNPFQGLGLVKTANGLPRRAEAGKNAPWAASPNWVWNLITGHGDPDVQKHIADALRRQVKGDAGIFCYRGKVTPDKLDTTTNAGMYTVAYPTYSGALLVFNAPGSVGYIQFFKENWADAALWKYRNAIDGNLKRWTAWKTLTTTAQLAAHTNNKSNPHGVTKAQIGLGSADNTADKDKSVKYAASAKHSATSNLLQAYTADNYTGGNHFIKAIRENGWNMRLYGCYFNGAKQSDCVKVNYANTAGKAAAAGSADSAKNADTVDGYHAGNKAGMLVPVVAFNVGESAGYIKLGNGLIVQWGRLHSDNGDRDCDGKTGYWRRDTKRVTLPIRFVSAHYIVMLQGEDTPRDRDKNVIDGFLAHNKSQEGFTVTHWPSSDDIWDESVYWCNWVAIGI